MMQSSSTSRASNIPDQVDRWLQSSIKLEESNNTQKELKEVADKLIVNESFQMLKGLLKEIAQTEWMYSK